MAINDNKVNSTIEISRVYNFDEILSRIEAGHNANAKLETGKKILDQAIFEGKIDIAKLAIEHGATHGGYWKQKGLTDEQYNDLNKTREAYIKQGHEVADKARSYTKTHSENNFREVLESVLGKKVLDAYDNAEIDQQKEINNLEKHLYDSAYDQNHSTVGKAFDKFTTWIKSKFIYTESSYNETLHHDAVSIYEVLHLNPADMDLAGDSTLVTTLEVNS